MTSVGRLRRAMVWAMVKVLPVPVAPRRVWKRWPEERLAVSLSIAWGWSPWGWKGEMTWKRFFIGRDYRFDPGTRRGRNRRDAEKLRPQRGRSHQRVVGWVEGNSR